METQQKTSIQNRLIAEFMGYIHYHPGIDIDYYECGGFYTRKEIFSKVPILAEEYPEDDQYYFATVPNPDYQSSDKSRRWNPQIRYLSWATINGGEYTYDLDYNTNWNSLMKVRDKIEELGYRVIISTTFTRICLEDDDLIEVRNLTTSINCTIIAFCDFIEDKFGILK